jgi:transposase
MKQVCRIGLDIAKYKFQVHGVDKHGKDVFNKQLNRKDVLAFFIHLPVCKVGLEACGGAHYWGREIQKLGHTVGLISPRHVKPFVINNKTDAADARAICEVAGRPSTRFVSVKTEEQQDMSAWHCIRERLLKSRTALANQIRGLLSERGIILPQGIAHVRKRLPEIVEDPQNGLSITARDFFSDLYTELHEADERLAELDRKMEAITKTNEHCNRLMKIPGIGPVTASALVAHVGDAKQFKNGRELAAYLGLTPREYSSGGKQKLLGITKRGNTYIRKLLIQGARNVCRAWSGVVDAAKDRRKAWLQGVSARRGQFVASVAQANKTARIAWAILARGEEYQAAKATN